MHPYLRRAAGTGLRAAGLYVERPPKTLVKAPRSRLTIDLEHLIARVVIDNPDLFFVQIGAFDGTTGDQLHDWIVRFRWRGILVEPQPRQFEMLQRTYAGFDLDLRNVAIGPERGTRTLYTVRQGVPGLPEWAPQVASLDREQVEAQGLRGPDGEDVIERLNVQCITLSDLLADVPSVDLLQIDVEGYDAEIIRLFDFRAYSPTIVRFENLHLSREDHDAAVGKLLEHGYSVAVPGFDTIAWKG